jgi:hypothetical protein
MTLCPFAELFDSAIEKKNNSSKCTQEVLLTKFQRWKLTCLASKTPLACYTVSQSPLLLPPS